MQAPSPTSMAQPHLQEHVLLTGGEIHLVFIVIHTDVDNISQQLLIARDNL